MLSMSRLKIAHLSIYVIKLAVFRWVVWRVRALRCFESPRTRVGGHLLVEDQCSLCSLLSVLLRRPPLRRITKPTGRTFDLQDHRVRAAVRQALKNVACASSARPRGSAGPIRAEPLYCQFDLPVRRHPIGSYEFFLVLCHLVPDNLYVCRASRL
jgi:hypothetical protein